MQKALETQQENAALCLREDTRNPGYLRNWREFIADFGGIIPAFRILIYTIFMHY